LLVLFLAVAGILLYAIWPGFRPRTPVDWIQALALGLCLGHLQFATTGWLLRYEAYLVALAWVAIAPAAGPLNQRWKTGVSARVAAALGPARLVVLGVVILGVSQPLAWRTLEGIALARYASHNIYEQQIQMARFLRQNYNHSSVAINDIGAITYYTDLYCVDLFGLANRDVARARLDRNYTTQVIQTETLERHVELAIVYPSWFDGANLPSLPGEWIRVGSWTVARNYVLGDSTVTFYALQREGVEPLARRLRDFDSSLPKDVVHTSY
jgi:hypothetical protein